MRPTVHLLRSVSWFSSTSCRLRQLAELHTVSSATGNPLIWQTESPSLSLRSRRSLFPKTHKLRLPWIYGRRTCFSQERGIATPVNDYLKSRSFWSWAQQEEYVKVGGNGCVKLEIHKLQRVTKLNDEKHSTVDADAQRPESIVEETEHNEESQEPQANSTLIYLPPGLFPRDSIVEVDDEHEFQSLLSTLAQEPRAAPVVVRLEYRIQAVAGPDESFDGRFPTAIHDCVTCLDWILDHQSQWLPQASILSAGESKLDHGTQQVSLYGTHVGGGMALTLALTNPNMIQSVAVTDPIVDWVGLDEIAALDTSDRTSVLSGISDKDGEEFYDTQYKKTRRQKSTETAQSKRLQASIRSHTAQAMISLRTSIFRSPSGFFDPFASPILFLRAPGKDTPLWKSARPEREILKTQGSVLAYGPYDDDWQGAHPEDENATSHDEVEIRQTREGLDMITEALGADAARSTDTRWSSSAGSPQDQSQTIGVSDSMYEPFESSNSTHGNASELPSPQSSPQILEQTATSMVRRRKTMRRWPAIGRPEEVLLPCIKIYSTASAMSKAVQSKTVDLPHVLHAQAKEMVDLMRRACFWGCEKGFAEQRVSLEIYDGSEERNSETSSHARIEHLWSWLRQVPSND